jgi:hypothetical protein
LCPNTKTAKKLLKVKKLKLWITEL